MQAAARQVCERRQGDCHDPNAYPILQSGWRRGQRAMCHGVLMVEAAKQLDEGPRDRQALQRCAWRWNESSSRRKKGGRSDPT